jgi:hypothetical protein
MTEKTYEFKAGGKSYTIKGRADKEYQEDVLRVLNETFQAASLEKYDEAVLSLVMQEGMAKYGRGKTRIGQHQSARIQKHMIKRLRSMYGPFVTVLFNKKKYFCNLNMVYKTPQGRLFNSEHILNLFITSHALERFEERSKEWDDVPSVVRFKLDYRKMYGTGPTAFDYLDFLLAHCRKFLVVGGTSWYLYTGLGCLVVELYGDIVYVGKTFLEPHMVPKGQWFGREEPLVILEPALLESCTPIKEPFFISDDNDPQ